jgi:hypothetical protein
MNLTKDGITIEVSHPSDIARYKKIGYVEIKDNPNVAEVKETPPVVKAKPEEQVIVQPVTPEPTQQEKDQETVEKILQPSKKGKGKS